MKLTDRADAAEARQRLESLVGQVPQLRTLEVDLDVLGTDSSYDLCLVTTHDSLEDLDGYSDHPSHRAFKEWVGPRLAGRVVVDSER
jgi:hypothetical protein